MTEGETEGKKLRENNTVDNCPQSHLPQEEGGRLACVETERREGGSAAAPDLRGRGGSQVGRTAQINGTGCMNWKKG